MCTFYQKWPSFCVYCEMVWSDYRSLSQGKGHDLCPEGCPASPSSRSASSLTSWTRQVIGDIKNMLCSALNLCPYGLMFFSLKPVLMGCSHGRSGNFLPPIVFCLFSILQGGNIMEEMTYSVIYFLNLFNPSGCLMDFIVHTKGVRCFPSSENETEKAIE